LLLFVFLKDDGSGVAMNFEVRNLIDYFVVCGLDVSGSGLEPEPNEIYYSDGVSKPPLERAYKSKILNHFPANLPWNPFDVDAVTQVTYFFFT